MAPQISLCVGSIDKPIWAEKALKRLLKIDPDHEEAKELMRQCVTAKA